MPSNLRLFNVPSHHAAVGPHASLSARVGATLLDWLDRALVASGLTLTLADFELEFGPDEV